MYEARQNKEKVSRRIDGGGMTQQRLKTTNINNITQRIVSIDDFSKRFKNAGAKTIHVYTHVKSDGMGDAGQLGFLKDYLDSKELNVIAHATYYIPDSENGKVGKLKDLARISDNHNIYLTSSDSPKKKDVERTNLPEDDWQIHYPVPQKDFAINSDKALKIKEMGDKSSFYLKTGNLYNGIGYGIPIFKPYSEEMLNDEDKKIYNIIKSDIANAWFISVKPYKGTGNDMKTIIKKNLEIAQSNNVKLLIMTSLDENKPEEVKNDDSLNKDLNGKYFYTYEGMKILNKTFNTNLLRLILNNIKTGFIISGGEGLYAESLGATGDASPILSGRYAFQYNEIANDLLNKDNKIEISKNNVLEYRIFKKGSSFYICDDSECIYNINSINVGYGKYTGFEYKDCLGNSNLSALYFPLMINSIFKISKPSILKDIEEVKKIFRNNKPTMKDGNWFNKLQLV